MRVTTTAAVIMCGGRGSRMVVKTEKPLVKLAGVALVERVYRALSESGMFGRICAAASPSTPETKKLLQAMHVDVIDTEALGYPEDLFMVLSQLKPARVFVAPADLGLLSARSVRRILDEAKRHGDAPAVSILADKEFVEGLGVAPSVVMPSQDEKKQYCHTGISIFDTSQVQKTGTEESYIVINDKELAVNINTKEELAVAEKILLIQRAKDLAKDGGS